jgi:hypothetical protein
MIVLSLNQAVTSGNVGVTSGTGNVSGPPSFAGGTMTVNLAGVADGQTVTLSLSNVQDTLGRVLPNAAVSFNVLLGDASGNMAVNATDISHIKSQSGAPVTDDQLPPRCHREWRDQRIGRGAGEITVGLGRFGGCHCRCGTVSSRAGQHAAEVVSLVALWT